MSKSLGNFYTLRELLEKGVDPRHIRYVFVAGHYRQKLNFTLASVEAAASSLGRIDEVYFRLRRLTAAEAGPDAAAISERARENIGELRGAFVAALCDDLNVSAALAAVFGFVKAVNRHLADGSRAVSGDGNDEVLMADARAYLGELDRADEVFAVFDPEPWKRDDEAVEGPDDAAIDALVAQRQEARKQRDFGTADRIRDELQALGVTLEDTPQGPVWRRS